MHNPKPDPVLYLTTKNKTFANVSNTTKPAAEPVHIPVDPGCQQFKDEQRSDLKVVGTVPNIPETKGSSYLS